MLKSSIPSHLLLHYLTQLSPDTTPVLLHGHQSLKVSLPNNYKLLRRYHRCL